MKGDAYSALKATRHLDVVQAVRDGRPVRPVHVQVILSDLCNHACDFCAYRDPDYTSSQLFAVIEPGHKGLRRDPTHPERNFNPNRLMPWDKAQELLADCAELGVRGVQFTGGGEPTLHPNFAAALTRCQDLGLPYSVVTNGALTVGRHLAHPIALGAWSRVSLDAGDAQTYAAIRHVPERVFDATLAGVAAVRNAAELHNPKHVLGVGYVVTAANWRGVVEATALAKKYGAHNIRISAQFSADDEKRFAGFHAECGLLCCEAESLADDGFQVYNRFGAKLADLAQHAPDYDRCGYQHFTTYVGADLNVYRCCVLAYNERGVVGSIRGQRFSDLWLAQERADAMAAFDARGCARCQFNGINRNLDYMLRPDEPLHAGFV